MFRFFHIADLQLGAPNQPKCYREEALPKLIESARKEGIADILTVGDIFDLHKPDQRTKDYLLSVLLGADDINWLFTLGNHDYETKACEYHSLKTYQILERQLPNVKVCPPGITIYHQRGVDAVAPLIVLDDVWGTLPTLKSEEKAMLVDFGHPIVCAWHGTVPWMDFKNPGGTFKAPKGTIEKILKKVDADYLALGDIHQQLQLHERCWYPGSLTQKAYDERDGYLLVEISTSNASNGSIRVTPLRLDLPKRFNLSVSLKTDMDTAESVIESVHAEKIPEGSLVRLKFEVPLTAWAALNRRKLVNELLDDYEEVELYNEPPPEKRLRSGAESIAGCKTMEDEITAIINAESFSEVDKAALFIRCKEIIRSAAVQPTKATDLKFKSLHLNGFMSYHLTDFIPLDEPGITHIQGSTGAGKSTIKEAIVYLATGETLRKSAVGDLGNKIFNRGYDITLVCENCGDAYEIHEVRDTGVELTCTKNGEPLSSSTKPKLRALILEELGLTADELIALAFLGQDTGQELIDGTSSVRAEALVRLFKLNRYDAVLKCCAVDLDAAITERKALVVAIEARIAESTRLAEQRKNIEVAKPVDEAEINALQEQRQALEDKYNKLSERERDVKHAIGEAPGKNKRRDAILKLEKEITELEAAVCVDVDLPMLEKATQRYDKLGALGSQCKLRIEQLQASVQELEEAGDVCPINKQDCPVNVPSAYKQERLATCNEDLGAQQHLLGNIKQLRFEAKVHVDTFGNYQSSQRSLKEKQDARQALGQVPEAQDMEKLKALYSKCYAYRVALEKKMGVIRKRKEDLQTQKALAEQAETFRASVEKQCEEASAELDKKSRSLAVLDYTIQQLETALSVFKKLKLYRIDYVIDLLNTNINRILDAISGGAYHAHYVSQKEDSTGKRLLDSIELLFDDNYKEIPIEMASEGQKDYVRIAVFLAVFETARTVLDKKVSCIWLDEVFGPISNDKLDAVFEAIINTAQHIGVETINLISHRNLDARFFDHTWEVTMTNGISSINFLTNP